MDNMLSLTLAREKLKADLAVGLKIDRCIVKSGVMVGK